MRGDVNRRRDERGMALVVVGLSMVAILSIVAVVIDLGFARQEAQEGQNATDAAALAGARELPDGSGAAVVAALEIAVRDLHRTSAPQPTACRDPFPPTIGQQQTACYVVDGDYLEITANYGGTTRMRVESAQASPAFFGAVNGETGTPVVRAAVAQRQPGVVSDCGLCVLGTDTPFDGQNGDLVVTGDAGAAINGSGQTRANGCLAVANGSIVLHNGGSSSGNFGQGTSCDGVGGNRTTTVGFPLPNPLAFLDELEPSTSGTPKSGCGRGPGVYDQIPLGCDLLPGLYVITGENHLSGTQEIRAPGVTLFFADGAELTCTGQARVSITAPVTSPAPGVPPNLAIWFAADNEGALDCRGNGTGLYRGSIYAPSATLWNRGNGACTAFRSLVVVGRVQSSGDPSSCTIDYRASENVQIPWGQAYLVE